MSDDNADTEGYVLAADYAEELYLHVEYVTQQLRDGTLDGRIINNSWYVKKDATISEGSGTGATKPKATTKVRTVQVTGISIPFGDVLMVSFQFAVAGIILAIPLAFLILVISNS
jgi:hypothetical protein